MSLVRGLGDSEVNRTLPLPFKNSLFCFRARYKTNKLCWKVVGE